MSQEDRDFYIEWLTIRSPYTRDYWERQSDKVIKLKYRQYLEGAENV